MDTDPDPAVTRVPVPTETRSPDGLTNAYVVGTTLVDPADRTETLDAALPAGGPDHVVVTHTHRDHADGVVAYAADATVWAHADAPDRFREATGVTPDRTFGDGDDLPTDPPLAVLATPGHAPDHVCFRLDPAAGVARAEDGAGTGDDGTTGQAVRPALFVGDLAVAEGSVVVGEPEGDMRDYFASLERVRDHDPPLARLYPGHGDPIEAPVETCQRLIEHRLERERRVIAAVRAGVETVPAITDAAYDRDLTGVRDLAEATVRAHVEKLASEGRIRWDGERALSL